MLSNTNPLSNTNLAARTSFSGDPDTLSNRLDQLAAGGATGIILGCSGVNVERELRAFAELVGLSPR